MTIYDIAREAGVSISTVSRVINNKTTVDPLLKERVDEVLKKHNYQPNAIARGLATRSLKTVGVLLPDIRDLHYASIAYQIEQDLRTVDFNMIISNAGTNHESFAESLDMLAKRSVDGIILIGSLFMNEATVLALSTLADTVPVVYANGFLRLDSVGSVAVDIESGVRQAITHLHERGHRSIAYLGFSDTYSGKKKRESFGMIERTVPAVTGSSFSFDRAVGEADVAGELKRLLSSHAAPTALMFESDWYAVNGISALTKLGYRVPDDIAVVGYNNSRYCTICVPPLTSIDNKFARIGSRAAHMIYERIGKRVPPRHETLVPELCVREST